MDAAAKASVSNSAKASLDRDPELLVENVLRLVPREGRHVIVQPAKLLVKFLRHQIPATAQNLPEFDECRPQLLERQAQPNLGWLRQQPGIVDLQLRTLDAENVLQRHQLEDVREAVFEENLDDLVVARQVRREFDRGTKLIDDHSETPSTSRR